jgi:hypothetical protein
LHVLEVMLRALASGQDGQAHAVESTFEPPLFADPEEAPAAHRIHDRTRGVE